MLRMNREKKNLNTFIKKECANCDASYNCDGVMINKVLKQKINDKYANTKCRVINGKKCTYYDRCLKPLQGSY
mgnify:CR=1 FL=1